MKSRNYTESIVDDNGIELNVEYNAESTDPFWDNALVDAFNTGTMICTELKVCELVIAGRGIDLLPLLTEKEKEFIISKLSYE